MPVGNDAALDLLPTKEQREYMYHRIREIRGLTGGKQLFAFDFQNDGEFVGGCIAGGRNYFHINANGDAEPCVFIHYSSANIKEVSVLDALRQPLFMAYHNNQPFNNNHLRRVQCSKTGKTAADGTRNRRKINRPTIPGKRRTSLRKMRTLRQRVENKSRRTLEKKIISET